MNRQFSLKNILRQFIAVLLLINTGAGALAAQAVKTSNKPAVKPTVCANCWSGVVNYSRRIEEQFSSNEPVFGRINKDVERHIENLTSRSVYSGKAVVNGSNSGAPVTNSSVDYDMNEKRIASQSELTECHSYEQPRLITETVTTTKWNKGFARGELRSFSFSVTGDKFHLGVTFPDGVAQFNEKTQITRKNFCPNASPQTPDSKRFDEQKLAGAGFVIDEKFDPKTPDVISGTKSWTEENMSKTQRTTYTVSWKFTRKPQPLMITDIRFYQPIYPSPNDWQEIPDSAFAVDGNQVKIVATVANLGGSERTATVNFKELKENTALPDGAVTATVPANGQKDVEVIWDTSGYAWKQSGAEVVPETARRIEAQIPDDSMQKNLTVIPKPMIIVWGFWQSADSMTKFHDYIKVAGDRWAYSDGMTDVRKISTDNADPLDETVRKMQKRMNAWHVDLVAFQNGGLTARVYVNSKMPTQFDGRPTATHLVMVGVPNMGTPCAEGLYGLSFKMNTFNLDAVAELAPDSMKRFNLLVNNTNGTKFAAIAVDTRKYTCLDETSGDGFIPTKSALWRVKNRYVSTVDTNPRNTMGEVTHFRQIYKWLAVPPKGDHAPDPSTLSSRFADEYLFDSQDDANFAKTRRYGAMFNAVQNSDDADVPRPDFAKVVQVAGGKTTEIEIPVRNGSSFALNLFASPDVSATLMDASGEVVGTNLAGSAEAADIFRTIMVKRSLQTGNWKLRLENRAAEDTEIAVTAFIDYTSTIFR
jgi:hypothetical protein